MVNNWPFLKEPLEGFPVTDIGTVLAEYEGPAIALFNGFEEYDSYIGTVADLDWNTMVKRWILAPIDPKKWNHLRKQEMSLKNVFINVNQTKEIIVLDQSLEDGTFLASWKVPTHSFTSLLLPTKDSYLPILEFNVGTRIGEKRDEWPWE